jgi:hypothetical protein
MGPQFTLPNRGLRLLAAGMLVLAWLPVHAQVFVVGMKTATDDAVTEFHPTHLPLPSGTLNERERRELLRDLVSEQGFAHRQLPLSPDMTLVANGNLWPRDDEYRALLYKKGIAAQPGERVAITAVRFKPDAIEMDINGGPFAKHRFLSHIEIGDGPIAQRGPEATGSRVTLVFEGGVPAITAAEVKALLDPVIDFHARTSEEAYADTLPPRVKAAVAEHEVLVGMTRRMVLAALGQPRAKNREHVREGDETSPRYEEWIYGEPPQPTRFVRFRGDHVVQWQLAELGKPIVLHDKNEIGDGDVPVLNQRTIASGDAQPDEEGHIPTQAPTLKKPGEGK